MIPAPGTVYSSPTAAWLARAADLCYGAALFTLPWVGLGVVRLVSGVDTGAGFQPAFLLLALAVLLQGIRFLWLRRRRAGTEPGGTPVAAADPIMAPLATLGNLPLRLRWYLGFGTAIFLVVALSVLGIWLAPAPVMRELALARFGKQFIQLIIMMCFTVYVAVWTRGPERWSWTLRLLAAGMIFQAAYALGQVLHFHRPSPVFAALERVFTSNPAILSGSEELYIGGIARGIPRLRGTMCEPLYLGNYLLLVIPFLLLSGRRIYRWALVALASALLLWTWARGTYLGLAAGSLVGLVLLLRSRIPWRPARSLALLATVVAGILLTIGLFAGWQTLWLPWERLLQSLDRHDWSNLTRYYSMQAAWRGFLLNPWTGLGWGQFGFHFAVLVDPLGLQSQFTWPVVNNYPLQILAETGLPGGLVLLLSVTALAGMTWRSVVVGAQAPRVIAAAVAVTGIGVQLLTFSQYNLPHIWVALGLLLASFNAAPVPTASKTEAKGASDDLSRPTAREPRDA